MLTGIIRQLELRTPLQIYNLVSLPVSHWQKHCKHPRTNIFKLLCREKTILIYSILRKNVELIAADYFPQPDAMRIKTVCINKITRTLLIRDISF